jgi:hypothetical protein
MMKALTISEPFASLIINLEKWVENRTWYTSYRGPLAIHAGKGTQYLDKEQLKDYPAGCVIGTCDLVGCYEKRSIMQWADWSPQSKPDGCSRTWAQLVGHKHTEGPYCFLIENVVKFDTPIPAKGKQGFWEWDESLMEVSK